MNLQLAEMSRNENIMIAFICPVTFKKRCSLKPVQVL